MYEAASSRVVSLGPTGMKMPRVQALVEGKYKNMILARQNYYLKILTKA